jgi:hypothetical protein
MLTPHILKAADDASAKQAIQDIANIQEGVHNEAQWLSRTWIADERYKNAKMAYDKGDYKTALKEVNGALEVRPTYVDALRLQKQLLAKQSASAVSTEKLMQDSM